MSTDQRVDCPYCQQPASLVGGRAIYPHRPDLYGKRFYQCVPCGAWVGCHDGTQRALGRLANAELRRAKQSVHAAFDPHWRGVKKKHARFRAYRRLARELGIPMEECHVGMFDVERCKAALLLVQAWGPPGKTWAEFHAEAAAT